jgi:uncharacterized coiled-coil DUF342 family protein
MDAKEIYKKLNKLTKELENLHKTADHDRIINCYTYIGEITLLVQKMNKELNNVNKMAFWGNDY